MGGGFAKLAPGTFEAGEVSWADQGRSRVMLKNRGHLRVYADRATGRFLGAEMAGPAAEHGNAAEMPPLALRQSAISTMIRLHGDPGYSPRHPSSFVIGSMRPGCRHPDLMPGKPCQVPA